MVHPEYSLPQIIDRYLEVDIKRDRTVVFSDDVGCDFTKKIQIEYLILF